MKKNHQKLFTTGEIFRNKMLINHQGKPYASKSAVLGVVRLLPHTKVRTAFGIGYAVTLSTINAHNAKMRATIGT